jgi:hypothetical protein
VITGTSPGKPLSDLQPFWQRVRARAGLKDVRLHDLRHTFASVAVASGQGLPMIGKLLGHSGADDRSVRSPCRRSDGAYYISDAPRWVHAEDALVELIGGRRGNVGAEHSAKLPRSRRLCNG